MHVVKNHKAQIYGEESSPGGKGDKKGKTSVKHGAVVVEAHEEEEQSPEKARKSALIKKQSSFIMKKGEDSPEKVAKSSK